MDQNFVIVPLDTPISRLGSVFAAGKVALVQKDNTIQAVVTKIDLIDHVAGLMR